MIVIGRVAEIGGKNLDDGFAYDPRAPIVAETLAACSPSKRGFPCNGPVKRWWSEMEQQDGPSRTEPSTIPSRKR